MDPDHPPDPLTGQIERITYSNEETGYTVARVRLAGQHQPVTVVGHLMAPMPGETLEMSGQWTQHPRYGRQFQVDRYRTVVPVTIAGIEKYLGSGLIRGIGPEMAKRIVARFGEQALTIIEHDCSRLEEVAGIGPKRCEMIRAAWQAQSEIRDLILFLQSHNVSSTYATRIYKRYADNAIAAVKQNPYRLAEDIRGIGFLSADRIAANLGFDHRSPKRLAAGVLYALRRMAEEGHVYCPQGQLVEKCVEILRVGPKRITDAVADRVAAGDLAIEQDDAASSDGDRSGHAVFLRRLQRCEHQLATRLLAIQQTPSVLKQRINPAAAVDWVQRQLTVTLDKQQKSATRSALAQKVLIVTGGPGTGKTTTIDAIIKILRRKALKVLLAAPTGRAAKRMHETTGLTAKTIHRLLEYSFHKGGFQRNEDRPLTCDCLIVDEASMIDTVLMHHLLKAVADATTLVLVGDVHQLPSVGAGMVLDDMIRSERFEVVRLQRIFRQARESRIIVNAHRINAGQMPRAPAAGAREDFFLIRQPDPERALNTIVRLVHKRIPSRFGLDPIRDIQVITPMHKGIVGSDQLNRALQEALNPDAVALQFGGRLYHRHDKVMQTRNNYDKNVFNGDIGVIEQIDLQDQRLAVNFDGRIVHYDSSDGDELVTAYAISVHKAQGSEYPAVVIPIMTQHYVLLQRNLLYTAVTRGKKLVVVVGSRRALQIAVNTAKSTRRFTRLKQRLMAYTI